MNEPQSSTPDYTIGFSDDHIAQLSRSTVENSAGHLTPHLKPGLRVLDFGCGPGSISVGLARLVEPGEFHGIDMEASQVELCRSSAASLGLGNAIFQVADATDLPFEDGFFDVVHGHDVLGHIPDTHSALAEAKRVLKSGGIIGCREMICRSCFTHPDFGVMERSWEMYEDIVTTDGGHPQMGKDLKGHLVEAGFTDIRITGSLDIYSTPEDIDFIHQFVNGWMLSPEFTESALHYGAATVGLLERTRAAYDRWKDHPGALCVLVYGEAVGIKP